MKTVTARATARVVFKKNDTEEVKTNEQFRGEGENREEALASLLANMQLFRASEKDIIGEVEYGVKSPTNIRSHNAAESLY